MRQNAFLDPDHEHVAEFEAFSRVQGRQTDCLGRVALLTFEHGDQRNHLRQLEHILSIGLAFGR